MAVLPEGMIARNASKTHFRAEDRDNPDYFIDGTLLSGTSHVYSRR